MRGGTIINHWGSVTSERIEEEREMDKEKETDEECKKRET